MTSTLIQGAVDGLAGNRVALRADSAGRLITGGIDTMAVYSASVTGLVVAALATDIFLLTGSVSKTLRVRQIIVSGIATAAGAYALQLIKRSTANTGGTLTLPTAVPLDSSFAAGAVTAAYTANPGALGTAVGTMSVRRLLVSTSLAATTPFPVVFDFESFPIVLRGTAQSLCVNLNGVTMAGGNLDIELLWTEE